jgi:ribosome recycling factor
MAVDEVEFEVEDKMDRAVEFLRSELRGLRTGRASSGLVEHLKIDYYGSPTELRQLANISTPEANLIVIKPFDPSSLQDIDRAIQTSSLGINPQSDGKIIRLVVPPLSGERRTQLIQQVKQVGEQSKVTVRNARRDGNHLLDQQQKEKEISEDDRDGGKESIQKLTDQYAKKIDELIDAKVAEVNEF